MRRLSLEGEISPGSGALKLQLAPTALATSSYGIETVRGQPRTLTLTTLTLTLTLILTTLTTLTLILTLHSPSPLPSPSP